MKWCLSLSGLHVRFCATLLGACCCAFTCNIQVCQKNVASWNYKKYCCFSKNAVLQKKKRRWTLWFWMGFAPVVWAYFRPGLARSSPGRAPMNCATSFQSWRERPTSPELSLKHSETTETGTGMRVLGKGLLLVDEASQLQLFFGRATYLILTTATTTVASVDMLISLVPHICPAWQGEDHQWQLLLRKSLPTPVMLLEPTVRRSTLGSTLSRSAVVFSNQTKSQNIYSALRVSHLYRASQRSPRLHDHCKFSFAFIVLLRIHRTARTALRRRAGCRSCMLPASCAHAVRLQCWEFTEENHGFPWIAIYYWRSRGDLGIVVGLKTKSGRFAEETWDWFTTLGNRTCLYTDKNTRTWNYHNRRGKSKSFWTLDDVAVAATWDPGTLQHLVVVDL